MGAFFESDVLVYYRCGVLVKYKIKIKILVREGRMRVKLCGLKF